MKSSQSTNSNLLKSAFFTLLLAGLASATTGCSKAADSGLLNSLSEDSSASGAAASSVGGAISSSDSNGTVALNQAPQKIWALLLNSAVASNACPKITTANGLGCTNAANAVDLQYSSCTFGASAATWSGLMEVTLANGAAVSCGTFPSPVSTSLQRQFVASAGVAGTGTRTSANGTVVNIDHQSANLSNFDNQTIAGNIGTHYGTSVAFNGSGVRTGVVVKQRVYVTGSYDHSVVGNLSISETGTTRTVSGSATVYHNKLKVVGTSTFTNVTYNNTSCVPVSGSITTSFAAGANVSPGVIGSAFVGKSETLTFNSGGTATMVDPSGNSTTVQMAHCF